MVTGLASSSVEARQQGMTGSPADHTKVVCRGSADTHCMDEYGNPTEGTVAGKHVVVVGENGSGGKASVDVQCYPGYKPDLEVGGVVESVDEIDEEAGTFRVRLNPVNSVTSDRGAEVRFACKKGLSSFPLGFEVRTATFDADKNMFILQNDTPENPFELQARVAVAALSVTENQAMDAAGDLSFHVMMDREPDDVLNGGAGVRVVLASPRERTLRNPDGTIGKTERETIAGVLGTLRGELAGRLGGVGVEVGFGRDFYGEQAWMGMAHVIPEVRIPIATWSSAGIHGTAGIGFRGNHTITEFGGGLNLQAVFE